MATAPKSSGGGKPSYTKFSRLSQAKAKEYSIVSKFPLGYRNREDITNLPPGVLVKGSQNVLTNVSERIQVRKGYTLDGQANTALGGILGAFDFTKSTTNDVHVRGNDNASTIEYRFVDSNGTVTWRTLASGFTSTRFRFCTFWDATELSTMMLFVNGTSNIYEWSGATATISSAGVNTLTKTGTTSWAQDGFYTTGTRRVIIGGVAYTYTGGESTTTLTGVTPDPNGVVTAGAIVHQEIRTTANSAMTSISSTFKNDIIENLAEQIIIGSNGSVYLYFSKTSDYKDYSFSLPRLPGEGAKKTMSGYCNAVKIQEGDAYVSAGLSQWYKTEYVQTTNSYTNGSGVVVSTVYEQLNLDILKTSGLQGAISQEAVTNSPNSLWYVSNEPTVSSLGRVENILQTPQITIESDPIKLDIDEYDLTDSCTFYYRYFTYMAVPKEGIVRVFNHVKNYWEAPLLLPIGRFSVIDGVLYGHDYNVPQSYKLFDGYNDNGKSIEARAVFSFQNSGSRSALKNQNAFYVEGYITPNTTFTLGIQYDIDGCATVTSYDLDGSNTQFVCISQGNSSLGKDSLGKHPLGGDVTLSSSTDLPPKFRWIPTFTRKDFYEQQVSFESIGIDQRWEILAFGGNAVFSTNEQNSIKD